MDGVSSAWVTGSPSAPAFRTEMTSFATPAIGASASTESRIDVWELPQAARVRMMTAGKIQEAFAEQQEKPIIYKPH